ncbi:MAG: DNA gyrase C-terminal beta-propeller domain-containing protein, partial [Planctomycetota bacterium]|jgi:DNA gyrase subunit A
MATAGGVVKKTPLVAYSRPQRGGIIALKLNENDTLITVRLTAGDEEVLLGTAAGRAIRFREVDVRPMGRVARGVRGIRLAKGDRVVGLVPAREGYDLLTACERGYGKRTPFEEYRLQTRGGQGTINIRTKPRNGPVIGVKFVCDDDDLILMSEGGMAVRISAKSVRVIGRATQGVRLIRLGKEDRLISLAKVPPEEPEEEGPERFDEEE